MKTRRQIRLVLSVLLIVALMLPATVYAASSNNPKKPDKHKPVPATDVELVKKVTVKRPGPPIAPPAKGKEKKSRQAATGILGDSVSGSRYAIVVGISDYPGTENDLNYSDDDAKDMYDALVNVYGFNPENITLLKDADATRSAILTAIENVGALASSDDEVVFFFSGHGMKGIADDGDNEKIDEAIVAHDGTNLVAIWDGELREALSGFLSSRIVSIFDTCLAGGMKEDLEAPGRVIAMATTERELAIESDTWQNGEFTYFFVDEGTLQGKANIHDYDGDTALYEPTQVTVEEAFDYAKGHCSFDKPTVGDYFDNDLLL